MDAYVEPLNTSSGSFNRDTDEMVNSSKRAASESGHSPRLQSGAIVSSEVRRRPRSAKASLGGGHSAQSSTKTRRHVQSLLTREREDLAEQLVATKNALMEARLSETKLRSKNQYLESELSNLSQETSDDKEIYKAIASRRSKPSSVFNQDPALIKSLKAQNRQLRAACDELANKLKETQQSISATRVEELEAESSMYLEEMHRQKKLAAHLERRLRDSEAALATARTMLAEKTATSKQMQMVSKLYGGTEGSNQEPSQSDAASRSLRQELQMATIQAGKGLAGGSKDLRTSLACMQSAHRLLLAEAAALRHFLPEGCTWGDLDPQRWKGGSPRGASAILRFLRTHEQRLQQELSGLPGAKKHKEIKPPKVLDEPTYHVHGLHDQDKQTSMPNDDDEAAQAWREEAARLRQEMDTHMQAIENMVDHADDDQFSLLGGDETQDLNVIRDDLPAGSKMSTPKLPSSQSRAPSSRHSERPKSLHSEVHGSYDAGIPFHQQNTSAMTIRSERTQSPRSEVHSSYDAGIPFHQSDLQSSWPSLTSEPDSDAPKPVSLQSRGPPSDTPSHKSSGSGPKPPPSVQSGHGIIESGQESKHTISRRSSKASNIASGVEATNTLNEEKSNASRGSRGAPSIGGVSQSEVSDDSRSQFSVGTRHENTVLQPEPAHHEYTLLSPEPPQAMGIGFQQEPPRDEKPPLLPEPPHDEDRVLQPEPSHAESDIKSHKSGLSEPDAEDEPDSAHGGFVPATPNSYRFGEYDIGELPPDLPDADLEDSVAGGSRAGSQASRRTSGNGSSAQGSRAASRSGSFVSRVVASIRSAASRKSRVSTGSGASQAENSDLGLDDAAQSREPILSDVGSRRGLHVATPKSERSEESRGSSLRSSKARSEAMESVGTGRGMHSSTSENGVDARRGGPVSEASRSGSLERTTSSLQSQGPVGDDATARSERTRSSEGSVKSRASQGRRTSQPVSEASSMEGEWNDGKKPAPSHGSEDGLPRSGAGSQQGNSARKASSSRPSLGSDASGMSQDLPSPISHRSDEIDPVAERSFGQGSDNGSIAKRSHDSLGSHPDESRGRDSRGGSRASGAGESAQGPASQGPLGTLPPLFRSSSRSSLGSASSQQPPVAQGGSTRSSTASGRIDGLAAEDSGGSFVANREQQPSQDSGSGEQAPGRGGSFGQRSRSLSDNLREASQAGMGAEEAPPSPLNKQGSDASSTRSALRVGLPESTTDKDDFPPLEGEEATEDDDSEFPPLSEDDDGSELLSDTDDSDEDKF